MGEPIDPQKGADKPGSATNEVKLTLPETVGLYIHIPWCVRKCPYCDFNSHEVKVAGAVNEAAQDAELPEQEYLAALLDDLKHDLPYVRKRPVSSIFFGGGTPSLMSGAGMQSLMDSLRKTLAFTDDIEVTLEANPGTAERQRFADYFQAGINRLSIGVQSFDAEHLKALGRIHNPDDVFQAVGYARDAGFTRLNLDLMYGLSGQTVDQALNDLQTAIDLQPEHISWYQLTIEPNTAFYKHTPELPDESTLIAIQDAGLALLAENGYQRYEVSAFAKPGEASRHNVNYWQFGDYLGIGAGAHGKMTQPHRRRILRLRKRRQPDHYLAAAKHSLSQQDANLLNRYPYLADAMPVEPQELPLEFLMNALRLKAGFSRSLYTQRTGLPFDSIAVKVEALKNRQLLTEEDEQITTTDLGYQYLNSVLEAFL